MHAVIIEVRVDLAREQEARGVLRELIVPMAKSRSGFTAGYWLRSLHGDVMRAVQIYESEEIAQGVADQVRLEGPGQDAPVLLESIDTYEVLAHA